MDENQVLDQKPTPILPPTATGNGTIRFVKVQPEFFGGITKEMDILIDFSDDSPIVGFKGDQGVGKTSMLNFLRFIMAGDDADNSINTKYNERKGELVLEDTAKNIKYVSRCTKTGF